MQLNVGMSRAVIPPVDTFRPTGEWRWPDYDGQEERSSAIFTQ
jgi:hypothetical protein